MTKTAIVRARIEPSVKEKAENILRKIGLTPSQAISVFYHRIASEKAIPFSLHIPNAETRKAITDARAGKNLTVFDTNEAFNKYIRAL